MSSPTVAISPARKIIACTGIGVTATVPKSATSPNRKKGLFVKDDFQYDTGRDVYICPAGQELTSRYSSEENGLTLRRYYYSDCPNCPLHTQCTTGKERRVIRWENEHLIEEMQQRLNQNPGKTRQRRATVEHPFRTMKTWMGATHFRMSRLKNVRTETVLHVLAYNLTRVLNIIGVGALMRAMAA